MYYKLIAKIDETNTDSMLDYSTNPKYYSKTHRNGFIVMKGSYDREDLVYRMNRRKSIMTGRQYHNLILDSLEIVEAEEPMMEIFTAFKFNNPSLVEDFIDPNTGKIK